MLGIPGILHEQNAVMGRANRALARCARSRIALSFAKTKHAEAFAAKSVLTGNPVRDQVRAVAGTPYPALDDTGRSGSSCSAAARAPRRSSDIVPPAIAQLPEALRHRLRIVQQCRAEDLDRVAEAYRQAQVNVELQPFFTDLPERMAARASGDRHAPAPRPSPS